MWDIVRQYRKQCKHHACVVKSRWRLSWEALCSSSEWTVHSGFVTVSNGMWSAEVDQHWFWMAHPFGTHWKHVQHTICMSVEKTYRRKTEPWRSCEWRSNHIYADMQDNGVSFCEMEFQTWGCDVGSACHWVPPLTKQLIWIRFCSNQINLEQPLPTSCPRLSFCHSSTRMPVGNGGRWSIIIRNLPNTVRGLVDYCYDSWRIWKEGLLQGHHSLVQPSYSLHLAA